MSMPDEDAAVDHAAEAAAHLLALVMAADPTFAVTPERHAAAVALVESAARFLAAGR